MRKRRKRWHSRTIYEWPWAERRAWSVEREALRWWVLDPRAAHTRANLYSFSLLTPVYIPLWQEHKLLEDLRKLE